MVKIKSGALSYCQSTVFYMQFNLRNFISNLCLFRCKMSETRSRTSSGSSGHGDSAGHLLQCPLCSAPYDEYQHEAKLLSCHHSMCLGCAQQLAIDRPAFKCPLCRKKTTVPAKGVSALQTNFYVSSVRDIVVPGAPAAESCPKHSGQPLLFFCETCMQPICMNCTVLDHEKSAGHIIKDITDTLKLHTEILQAKVHKAERSIADKQNTLQCLRTEMGTLETTKSVAFERLNETFVQLQTKLEGRKKAVMKELEDLYTARKQEIVEKAQSLKVEAKQLQNINQGYQDMMAAGNPVKIVKAATDIDAMKQFEAMCQGGVGTKETKGFLEWKYEKGLVPCVEAISKFGEVRAAKALPGQIDVGVPHCTAGIATGIKVEILSLEGNELDGLPITVNITGPNETKLSNKVSSQGNGVYLVRFRPQLPGPHTIHLMFLGHPLGNFSKAFVVESNNPVQVIGSEGKKEGQLFHPTSVCLGPNNMIYVADMGNKRIHMFDLEGGSAGTFTVGSSKATTYDIAINAATQELFCTKVAPDGETGRMTANSVRLFGLDGEKRRQFINRAMLNALFITVNSKGWIICTDAADNCAYIYTKEGTVLKKFGTPGTDPGQFQFPAAICVNKKDEIFIVDTRNHRIQMFQPDGNFLSQFGTHGSEPGQLFSPRGISVDDQGNILVADSQNRIQIFRTDGTFVTLIDSHSDPISEPYNMTVTSDGHVFVADFKNNCIKKFRYM